jgi:glycosyltransferase involved in cell wall biosynthesis
MENEKVSVVMNCYNGGKYLRQAIDSLIKQTHQNWELIFWDNRSTDESESIVKSYSDNRIRYLLAQEHTCLGAARKLAVNCCKGLYVSFLDADDVYMPDNLSRKIEFIERESAGVVYGGGIYIDQNGVETRRSLPKYKSGNIFKDLLFQFEIEVPTLMIRRSILETEDLNFDDRIYGSEEYDLMLMLAIRHRFSVVSEYIAKIRIHHQSLTNSVMHKWASDRRHTLNKIITRCPEMHIQYANAFCEAFARADYYEARWLLEKSQLEGAKLLMKKNIGVNWRYLVLYILLTASPKAWTLVHKTLRSSRN